MAAVNTAFKKNRSFGPHNHPATLYYGTFGPLPIAAGNYHLWDVPPKVEFVDGYAEVTTAGGGTPGNATVGVMDTTDATSMDAAETILTRAAGSTGLTRMAAGGQVEVPEPTSSNEKYALVWNREAAATTNGETFIVCLLAVRDDLS
jgi:hypothetical protein